MCISCDKQVRVALVALVLPAVSIICASSIVVCDGGKAMDSVVLRATWRSVKGLDTVVVIDGTSVGQEQLGASILYKKISKLPPGSTVIIYPFPVGDPSSNADPWAQRGDEPPFQMAQIETLVSAHTLRLITSRTEDISSDATTMVGLGPGQPLVSEHHLLDAAVRHAISHNLDKVIVALRNGSSFERRVALTVLRKREPEPIEAIGAVTEALEHVDARVRKLSAEVLGEMGPRAFVAVPDLARATADSDEGVRSAAWKSLAGAGEGAMPIIVSALQGKDRDRAMFALHAVETMGDKAKTAVPRVKLWLQEPQLRVYAIRALGALGPEAKDAVPDLVQVLLVDNTVVKGSPVCKAAAVRALGRVGPAAIAAVPHLLRIRDNRELRPCAIVALAMIDSIRYFPALAEWLRDSNVYLWKVELDAVIEKAPSADSACALLCDLLKRDDPVAVKFMHADASLALGGLGAKGRTGIPYLVKVLRDSENVVNRLAAAVALSLIIAGDKPLVAIHSRHVMPVLLSSGRDLSVTHPEWCKHCAAALGSLGRVAREGLPILDEWHKAYSDPMKGSRSSRRACLEAIDEARQKIARSLSE